ncbi:methyltransferase of ATP-grasp peptide maturase system [Kibdelosporangium banguiense]|uniref:Protein-L-isoaspartate O-methyltransferase n=1 Tax=Kibdelosporangium banguiense TaxID=1365924 RepID=A0ABS4TCX8_9PSEU|nr:ATP-grasp peptide maturase system methyltransferase [Kibdelosporangium banguiense]MBP2322282.1 methyltransferase of ATP-grasp peptide maturase system [Kibdelosporangium banguiense]
MVLKADVEGTAARLRSRMVRALVRGGTLTDPAWREAFLTVPRHAFLPRYFQQRSGRWAAVDTGDEDWLTQIYADRVLVTQLDGDSSRWEVARATGPVSGAPTCSSSMPTIMAVMLEALQANENHRVLEIGTGTGYNAALLCVRLGSARVSTVDVDDSLALPAEQRLTECGFQPTCAVMDGVNGYPPGAPYDRVLCTCAVPRIPLAWLEQTHPGGLVVTTLSRPLGAGLVRITAGDGPTGEGRVLADDGRFMPLRAPQTAEITWPTSDSEGTRRATDLPAGIVSPTSPFEFFAGLDLPDVHAAGAASCVLLAHPDGSWVRHDMEFVVQGGPRRLWDEIEAAYQKWHTLGEPRRARFGITVTPDTQNLWLDAPDSPHHWPL